MEPRPQQPRPPQSPRSQPQGTTASVPSQPRPAENGYQPYPEGYDPTSYVAPPRSEYDYSPLDLAPPSQRRRRQLIAGILGALSILLIVALIIAGWVWLRDDTPSNNDTDNDRIAQLTSEAQANDNPTAAATKPASTEVPTKPAQPTATTAAAQGPTPQELSAFLPTSAMVPEGFVQGTDGGLDEAGVVDALGGSRPAETNLNTWGWSANVSRDFSLPDAPAGATSNLNASLHGFKDPASAAAAIPFFGDVLVNAGYTEQPAPTIAGADNVKMYQYTDENGGVTTAIYFTKGNVMYRVGGYASAGGDPTQDTIDFATAMAAA